MTNDKEEQLLPLPEPIDYCYEWDGAYGTRKFSSNEWNGRKYDRSVALFTADQMREYALANMSRRAESEAEVTELALCEVGRVVLRQDRLYRFKVVQGCVSCAEYAADSVREATQSHPVAEAITEIALTSGKRLVLDQWPYETWSNRGTNWRLVDAEGEQIRFLDEFESEFVNCAIERCLSEAKQTAPKELAANLLMLTDDQRMEIFNNFCKHCGCTDPCCQCWNDD